MVASFAELMQVQAEVAVAILRAHHSSWNGRYEVLQRSDPRSSEVKWDGTILYNLQDVIEPLQEMLDRADRQRGTETLEQYREAVMRFREALRFVLHENIHLLAGPGTSLAFPLDAYEGKAHKVFEEGVTERATQNALDDYIDALDLERFAPGIKSVQTPKAYAAYLPAVDEFSTALGRNVGLQPSEVVHRMAVVNSAAKFPVAAELLYAKHLSQLVPETAKADAISRIAEAMHKPFAAIHDYDPKDDLDIRMSAMAGRDAFEKAREEVQQIAEHWAGNQDLRRALDAGLGATTAPHVPQRNGQASAGAQTDRGQEGQPPTRSTKPIDRRRLPSGPAASPRD